MDNKEEVRLSVGTVHTLLQAIYAYDSGTMTPRKADMLAHAVGLAYVQLGKAVLPAGMEMGMPLAKADPTRTPLYACPFDGEGWTKDRPAVAYALMSAVTKAAPGVGLPNYYDPFFADREFYFSETLERLNLSGFDTYADAEGFAVYAPRRPAPVLAPAFRKVARHAPQP